MRYFIIFLLSGKVINLIEYKDQQTRDMAIIRYTHSMHSQTCYDDLQSLNKP